ncbi:AEC family transporter [Epibacterium sp. SM1979]|uniref:AEC family transporter n=1 Tax=Tritonibacter litoralis TaxID=2662264 RepID=A0A843YBB7_9RHOB|nr:AEC family transporter [Tritonibacter litoralis]MQQ08590.1 AEC family transporter [Tritonibacter litoralis]
MLDIFFRTLPFFAIIGLGFGAGRSGFLQPAATAALTRFVFFFPLSAMIFRFAANLTFGEIFDPDLLWAYLIGTTAAYLMAVGVALWRRQSGPVTAVEAQCFAIGNTGFLGLPMMAVLFGEASVAPVMLILAIDLIVFSSLIVILINLGRGQGLRPGTLWLVVKGLLTNPMILSITAGLLWAALELPIPDPMNEFLAILAGAATPGALFAIGASLAIKSAERIEVAAWLSFGKLVIHPACVAACVLWLIPVAAYPAQIAIATAALPVAGNVYMLAQHYGVAPQRVSAAIFLSTLASIITLPAVIAWVSTF